LNSSQNGNKDVLINPRNPENPDSKIFTGNIPQKAPPQSSLEIVRTKYQVLSGRNAMLE
jgi:hypothetical protein